MQLRDLREGKRDLLMFDPRIIQIDQGYNVRDLTAEDEQADLMELARSIADNGFSIGSPITIRLKDDKPFIVAGHRRLAATMIAINHLGADIVSIPAIAEAKGTSDADRVADLGTSNNGKPLKPLAWAEIIKRLIAFGWSEDKIAKRYGWSSTAKVDSYLTLIGAPEAVQEMVRTNEVSATTAVAVVRKHGDHATETLAAAKVEAKKEGKTRVTSSHVRAAAGEYQVTPGDIKVLIKALRDIADGECSAMDAYDIATAALETVGVIRPKTPHLDSIGIQEGLNTGAAE